MAEPNRPLRLSKLPTPKVRTPNPQAQQASARFLSGFLYKLIFFIVFIALLPLFPSQAPEPVNQSIFTRSWELLHLLIVGIAVSYGLFSRRNTEPELEKEASWKVDSPKAYISRILHASSDFDDDEVDSPHGPLDGSKIQTWSSQYYRNNPVVVVKEDETDAGHATNKPLYLPVRSLKSCAQDSGLLDSCNEFIDGHSGSVNGIEEFRDFDALNSKPEGSAVLPSPIPWRSRSGRMEVKDESASVTCMAPPPSCSLPPSVLEAGFGPSWTPSFRSPVTRTPSSTLTTNRLSPSSSLSPEMRTKSSEDLGRKKSFYMSTPPPAPPPPPPFLCHGYSPISDRKVASKSFKDELEHLSRRGREGFPSAEGFDPLMSPSRWRNEPVGRSVRTVRAKEVPSAMPARAVYEAHQPPPIPRYQAEKKNEFMEKVIVSSDDSDADDVASECSDKEVVSNSTAEAAPEANEVDKKADEFIAKFREQIRLQRIESIKRSSGQRSLRNSKYFHNSVP